MDNRNIHRGIPKPKLNNTFLRTARPLLPRAPKNELLPMRRNGLPRNRRDKQLHVTTAIGKDTRMLHMSTLTIPGSGTTQAGTTRTIIWTIRGSMDTLPEASGLTMSIASAAEVVTDSLWAATTGA